MGLSSTPNGRRTRSWWNSFVANTVPPEKWKENFRMSRCTCYSLCEQLGPYDEGPPMRMWEPIEVDIRADKQIGKVHGRPDENVRWAAFSFKAIRVDEIQKYFLALVSSLLRLNVSHCSILQLRSFNQGKILYLFVAHKNCSFFLLYCCYRSPSSLYQLLRDE